MNKDFIYTTETAAAAVGSHKKTIAKLCAAGEITAYKKLGKWLILQSDLIEWIKAS